MQAPTVLVTGGAGYIGSHTCKTLANSGFLPITFDDLSKGRISAVQWGPSVQANLSEKDTLIQSIRKYRPMGVIHFAGFIEAGESVTDPLKYYRNNFYSTISLLEAMRECGPEYAVNKIVFSSTAAVYGIPKKTPIPEDHPKAPINPYGKSKWMVEELLQDGASAYGLHSICLRYFNAAGADPDGDLGERHQPESHLIPIVLEVAGGLRPELVINGKDYPTPDGTCIRDYVHVSDLADAHVLALEALEKSANENKPATARAFNLANAKGYSILEVIECARKVTGHAIPTRMGQRRPGDPPALVGDASAALRELGWKPKHADLETMVKTAWEFMKIKVLD